MDKIDPPTRFGVFNPVGHIVMAYRSLPDLRAAVEGLGERGIGETDWVFYSPEEMTAQVDKQLASASALASIGQDLNLIKAHRELAQNGCSFLIVHAPDDEQAELVASVAQTTGAVAAQRYGRFIVEELIDLPVGEKQVFESPDRGLDLDLSIRRPK